MPLFRSQTLGELEASIMEVVWRLRKVTVREVLERLNKKKKIAYTTVMTVMGRLHDKGILKRELDEGGAYMYTPVKGKESFLASSSKKIINHLIRDYGALAVAQFIDVVESSNRKDVERWKTKLRKIAS